MVPDESRAIGYRLYFSRDSPLMTTLVLAV
jgi:hypothetical protein